MKKMLVGYIQGTHGLRGDLKVKNKFSRPDIIYKIGKVLFLNEEEHKISSIKVYKGSYLIQVDNLKNINLVEKYKGYDIYIDRDNLNLKEKEYLSEDLIGLKVISNNKIKGIVKNVLNNEKYDIIVIDYETEYMVPMIPEYILKVDLESKQIITQNIESLIL